MSLAVVDSLQPSMFALPSASNSISNSARWSDEHPPNPWRSQMQIVRSLKNPAVIGTSYRGKRLRDGGLRNGRRDSMFD
jgi:hypothetical protein